MPDWIAGTLRDILEVLDDHSGAVIGVSTIVYGLATILMVLALFRANILTRQLLVNQAQPRLKIGYLNASPPRLVVANVHNVGAHSVTLKLRDETHSIGYVGPLTEQETIVGKIASGAFLDVRVEYRNDLGVTYHEQIRVEA